LTNNVLFVYWFVVKRIILKLPFFICGLICLTFKKKLQRCRLKTFHTALRRPSSIGQL